MYNVQNELFNSSKYIYFRGMGTNNFNGSIPEEFGNMSDLQQW
jgi:hypothetical protein